MKCGVVNSRHVAGSRWLMLFGFETEGVYVDASWWNVGVVLVWLYKVEVGAKAFLEAIVSVELEFGTYNWVSSCVSWAKSCVVGEFCGSGECSEVCWGKVVGVGTWEEVWIEVVSSSLERFGHSCSSHRVCNTTESC